MKYLLIKGTLHVVGYSPDGDSMMFKAANPAVWADLLSENKPIFEEKRAKDKGAVQLRLQGVDALETHYSPEPLPTPPDLRVLETDRISKPVPGGYKQPAEMGRIATQELMKMLGVRQAEWRSFGKTTWIARASFEQNGQEIWVDQKQADVIPAYIVTSDIEKNGRPISWIFPGDTPDPDGTQLTKDLLASRLEQSVNYQLLRRGLVYPYFFMTLAGRLRDKLIKAVRQAQADALKQSRKKTTSAKSPKTPNLWTFDKAGTDGITITDLRQVTEEQVLYPYLFRKVIKTAYRHQLQQYWDALRGIHPVAEQQTPFALEGLFADGDPYVFIISDQDFVKLSEVVQLTDNTLRLLRQPMDIVFLT